MGNQCKMRYVALLRDHQKASDALRAILEETDRHQNVTVDAPTPIAPQNGVKPKQMPSVMEFAFGSKHVRKKAVPKMISGCTLQVPQSRFYYDDAPVMMSDEEEDICLESLCQAVLSEEDNEDMADVNGNF